MNTFTGNQQFLTVNQTKDLQYLVHRNKSVAVLILQN